MTVATVARSSVRTLVTPPYASQDEGPKAYPGKLTSSNSNTDLWASPRSRDAGKSFFRRQGLPSESRPYFGLDRKPGYQIIANWPYSEMYLLTIMLARGHIGDVPSQD
jgi:hypothetical protein